jgi:hypothetical protein
MMDSAFAWLDIVNGIINFFLSSVEPGDHPFQPRCVKTTRRLQTGFEGVSWSSSESRVDRSITRDRYSGASMLPTCRFLLVNLHDHPVGV